MPNVSTRRSATVGPSLPGRLPLVGHLARMRRDPLGMLVAASRLGDVTRVNLGPRGDAFVVTHPDALKRVFLDNVANYTKQTRGFDTLRVFLGQGLLTSEGEFWKRQRRIAQPAFHHGQIRRFADLMSRAAEATADGWAARATSREPFDVADEMMTLTLRIVGECLFSTDPSDASSLLGPEIELLLERFITRVTAPVALPLHWPLVGDRRVARSIRVMHELVDGIVAERRAAGPSERPDLLDMLIGARDEETGEGMNPVQLRDEVLTLLVAGHETTAAALSWSWSLLALHPAVDLRLEAELAALGDEPIGLETLPRLPTVTRVIHEALRLYPPAWIIARQTAADDELLGVRIPAGSLVITSPYATHRRADLFADPERFEPDRFDPAKPNGGFGKFAYFPFGGGPRVCIGNGFALMEAQLALATLRRRFRLGHASPDGRAPEALPLLTLRCRDGLPMRAEQVTAGGRRE